MAERDTAPPQPDPGGSGLARLLARVPFFAGLDADALVEIRGRGRPRRVEKGSCFFQQGEPAEALYVLLEGEVRLIQISPEGQRVPLHFVHPGEPFGGGPIMGHRTYPAEAEAMAPSFALRWDSATIQDLVDRHPLLARNMLKVVAARFAELQDRFRELATERVERRVARVLLRLAAPYGKTTERGIRVEVPLSRQDLADTAGTTLSTVSRIVSRWESEGLVESGRGWILLANPDALTAIAEETKA
ncbi:MAG: Crp/Fnr family transcriptional regulator [Candidatus Sericytochromatia bacterium]|nr:Crp/Fnr family transcriptional regulator [Candidatus Tanganyikabacteria bacterium]